MIQHVYSYGRSMKRFCFAFLFALLLPFASQAHAEYSSSELDTLVSTIALYPDPLLVHVLNASMYSDDIPSASAFAQAHKYEKGQDLSISIENARLNYDASVIALIPFPDVLRKMAKYRTWTAQLGYAVYVQRDDVLAAVQRLRTVAYNYGHLRSNEWVNVNANGYVTIDPVREDIVYVPEYNPHYVYYVTAGDIARVRYIAGVSLGAWFFNWGWEPFTYDWRYHRPIYLHTRHYRMPPPRHYGNNPPPPPRRFDHNPPPPPAHRVGHNPPPPPGRFGNNPPPPQRFDNPPPRHYGDNPQPRRFDHNPPINRDNRNPPPNREYRDRPQSNDNGRLPPAVSDDRDGRNYNEGRPGQDRYRNQMQPGNQGSSNPPPSNPPSNRRPSYDDNGGSGSHFGGGNNRHFDGGRHGGDDRRGGGNPPPHRMGGRR